MNVDHGELLARLDTIRINHAVDACKDAAAAIRELTAEIETERLISEGRASERDALREEKLGYMRLLDSERKAREEAEESQRVCGIVFWDAIRENVPHSLFEQIDLTLQNKAQGKAAAMQRISKLYERAEAAESRLREVEALKPASQYADGLQRASEKK